MRKLFIVFNGLGQFLTKTETLEQAKNALGGQFIFQELERDSTRLVRAWFFDRQWSEEDLTETCSEMAERIIKNASNN